LAQFKVTSIWVLLDKKNNMDSLTRFVAQIRHRPLDGTDRLLESGLKDDLLKYPLHYDGHACVSGIPVVLSEILRVHASTHLHHMYGITAKDIIMPASTTGVQLIFQFPWHRSPLPVIGDAGTQFQPYYQCPVISDSTDRSVLVYPYTPRSGHRDTLQDLLRVPYSHLLSEGVVTTRKCAHDNKPFFLSIDRLSNDDSIRLELLRMFDEFPDPKLAGARLNQHQLTYLAPAICTALAGDVTVYAIDYVTGEPLEDPIQLTLRARGFPPTTTSVLQSSHV
jgi:hypothetical protein